MDICYYLPIRLVLKGEMVGWGMVWDGTVLPMVLNYGGMGEWIGCKKILWKIRSKFENGCF